MSKQPDQPGTDWRWVRIGESVPCPLCAQPMLPSQQLILYAMPLPDSDERRQLPFHPLCAARVAARRVLYPAPPQTPEAEAESL